MTMEVTTLPASLQPPTMGEGPTPLIPQPTSLEATGLDRTVLTDLTLKAIYFTGRPSGRQLAQQIALPFYLIEELVTFLRQEQMVEIVGSTGLGEQGYQFSLTERGRHKAEEALERNQYVGPTPVPFDVYIEAVQRQSISNARIDRETFRDGLSHLVLGRAVLSTLGPAVNSGQSMLIYGASGNGKTSIATSIGHMLPGEVLIPYAVEVHGQIIKLFDPRIHQRVLEVIPEERRESPRRPPPGRPERRRDRRWVLAKRPVVSAGGELTLQDLELRYSPHSRFYTAPLQWRANNGILIIDDFGRQMIQPQELLNRWIVPMEQGIDHLTLHTGDTVDLPFDTLLIFSSNIPPGVLGDEAFFRRIRHKVETPNPTREEFIEILRRQCESRGVPYSDEAAQYLISTHYERTGRALKACHPRDIIDLLLDITRFFEQEPALLPEWLDLACASYFVETKAA